VPVLGLIAGSGPLPFEVAQAARERGLLVAIAAIEDNTDPAIEREADGGFTWVNAGQLGALIAFLKQAGAREVILAGAVSKAALLRDPSRLKPDARALALLAGARRRRAPARGGGRARVRGHVRGRVDAPPRRAHGARG
jgi:DUF1009 family protein